MKFIDFFAGIGGIRLGLEQAGHECVGFCEWDKFARTAYKAMYDTEGEWECHDVRTASSMELPKADLWCFGFPCQDISVAGKQKGLQEGERSGLFYEVMRLLAGLRQEDRPRWLLVENVKNLLSIGNGFDFARLLVEVGGYGYSLEWQLINSKDFGVPQNRERVFIIGHLGNGSGRKVFPISPADGEDPCELNEITRGLVDLSYKEFKQTEIARCLTARYTAAPTNHACENSGVLIEGDNMRIRRLTPREAWRLQGFPDEYFDKAKYKKEKIYFVGGEDICCAKLRAATEKPKLFDTETCALCTTKDMLDMEMSTMMENPSKNEHCNEQILNVNIVMIKSENMAHLECAANIIKCIDFMGMRCTMIKSQEAQTRTDIIVSARGQKENTVKYMRITTMCSLPLDKLYTILTLLKLIIELKIFTSTTLEANMQGFMRYTTDLEGNILLKVSNLEMEHIMQRTSDSALYKMAGNAVTVNVARAIGERLKEIEDEEA